MVLASKNNIAQIYASEERYQDAIELYETIIHDYKGDLLSASEEGVLEWIKFEDLEKLKQFDQNQKFTPYIFKDELFEGKFLLDNKCKVLEYNIRTM